MNKKRILIVIILLLLISGLGVGVYLFVSTQKGNEVAEVPKVLDNKDNDEVSGLEKCQDTVYAVNYFEKLKISFDPCKLDLLEERSLNSEYGFTDRIELIISDDSGSELSIIATPMVYPGFNYHRTGGALPVKRITNQISKYSFETENINTYSYGVETTSDFTEFEESGPVLKERQIILPLKTPSQFPLLTFSKYLSDNPEIQIEEEVKYQLEITLNLQPASNLELFEEVIRKLEY